MQKDPNVNNVACKRKDCAKRNEEKRRGKATGRRKKREKGGVCPGLLQVYDKRKGSRKVELVPRYPLQKAPFREGDEGLKVEGGFTFGRLQGGFKGA